MGKRLAVACGAKFGKVVGRRLLLLLPSPSALLSVGYLVVSWSDENSLKAVRMNIQIFGTKKSFDTKKAQRYFKERRVKFQFIDLKEKGMSKGELESVARAVGGIDAVIDPKAKDADTVALVQYLAADQKFDKVLDNQQILREPIVRNGRQATVGYEPDVWKGWE